MEPYDPQAIKAEIERRESRRARLVTQVRCESLGSDEIMVARDVSVGGMFINARFPIPLNSEVSLTFQVCPTGPSIRCRGRVTFSRVGQGMGIQFRDLDGEAQQILQKFVDEVA